MSSADRSQTERIRRLRSKIQAVRRAECKTCPEEGPQGPTDQSTRLSRSLGQQAYYRLNASGAVVIEQCCDSASGLIPGTLTSTVTQIGLNNYNITITTSSAVTYFQDLAFTVPLFAYGDIVFFANGTVNLAQSSLNGVMNPSGTGWEFLNVNNGTQSTVHTITGATYPGSPVTQDVVLTADGNTFTGIIQWP